LSQLTNRSLLSIVDRGDHRLVHAREHVSFWTLYVYMKARLEPKPSRVLHFRGVPLDVTDSEILQLSLPFGNVTNLVVSKKKNQVL